MRQSGAYSNPLGEAAASADSRFEGEPSGSPSAGIVNWNRVSLAVDVTSSYPKCAFAIEQGLADTARWDREHGWL